MANPVYSIKDTGRNSASTADVRNMASNILTSMTSVTTGTIAVTADATYDVSFTQPADTIIRNLIAIPAGNIVTAGASGDDVDFDLGTSAAAKVELSAEQASIPASLSATTDITVTVTDVNGNVQLTAEEIPEKASRWENYAQFPRTITI